MSAIDKRADEHRRSTISNLLDESKLHGSTIEAAKRIDETCARLTSDNARLTITNVAYTLNRLFPSSTIGESTIRNGTPSGALYRAVIEAWRVCQFAKSHSREIDKPYQASADIADSLINRIQPEEAKLSVLLMRTALRNAKTQLNVLQGMTSERLIHPSTGGSPTDGSTGPQPRPPIVSKAELNCLRAFADEMQAAMRGLSWGPEGELTATRAGASTGPAIRDALLKVLAFVESCTTV
ncbi:hypothetical protein PQR33_32860 [Paraburkholderia sediminicola]|uniref:hypothetical protein n=1 Tax=Paraburkholderia sediminicola TaxID=458836 RepID=UPI0038BD6954